MKGECEVCMVLCLYKCSVMGAVFLMSSISACVLSSCFALNLPEDEHLCCMCVTNRMDNFVLSIIIKRANCLGAEASWVA